MVAGDAALKKRVKTEELRNIELVTSCCILFSAFIAPVFRCVSSISHVRPFCYCYHLSPLRYDYFYYYLVSFLFRYILSCVLTELKFKGAFCKVFASCTPHHFISDDLTS